MTGRSTPLRAAMMLVVAASIVMCPLAATAYAGRVPSGVGLLQPPIQFTPNVQQLQLTSMAATAFATGVPTAGPVATQTTGPPVATVSGNTITIGNETYPIGETFTDASQIPMGLVDEARFGQQGYSTILAVGAQDYRLMWVTDRGERKYLITREDDSLFSGPEGFKDAIDDLQVKEELTFDAIKIELGGLGAILAAEIAVCPLTEGGGCVAFVATGVLGLIGGFALGMWRVFTEWIPAINNVNNAFIQADINSP